mmetsp:Transcript_20887/g.53063  ORF Transcript_20887/g.53063 Transcript_20887/m.53063 type:complete len:369 (+) Transcript_20887:43-1149(+)
MPERSRPGEDFASDVSSCASSASHRSRCDPVLREALRRGDEGAVEARLLEIRREGAMAVKDAVNKRIHGQSLVSYAVHRDQHSVVRWLLEAGASVSVPSKRNGLTAVHEAAGRPSAVDLLPLLLGAAENTAVVNATTSAGDTPLHYAARQPAEDTATQACKLLLEARAAAMIDHRNLEGRSALMEAAQRDTPRTVLCLLHASAQVDLRDVDGNVAADLAAREGARQALQVLQEGETSRGDIAQLTQWMEGLVSSPCSTLPPCEDVVEELEIALNCVCAAWSPAGKRHVAKQAYDAACAPGATELQRRSALRLLECVAMSSPEVLAEVVTTAGLPQLRCAVPSADHIMERRRVLASIEGAVWSCQAPRQ